MQSRKVTVLNGIPASQSALYTTHAEYALKRASFVTSLDTVCYSRRAPLNDNEWPSECVGSPQTPLPVTTRAGFLLVRAIVLHDIPAAGPGRRGARLPARRPRGRLLLPFSARAPSSAATPRRGRGRAKSPGVRGSPADRGACREGTCPRSGAPPSPAPGGAHSHCDRLRGEAQQAPQLVERTYFRL